MAKLYRIDFGGRHSHYFVTDNLPVFLASYEKNNIEYFDDIHINKIADSVVIDNGIKPNVNDSDKLLDSILKEEHLFEENPYEEDPYEEDLRF